MTFSNILSKYPDTHSVTFELDGKGSPTYIIYEIHTTEKRNLPDWGQLIINCQNGKSTHYVSMVREKFPRIRRGGRGGK